MTYQPHQSEDVALKTARGRYVRWASVWHDGRPGATKTWCGRRIPLNAERQLEQPPKAEACGKCFDV